MATWRMLAVLLMAAVLLPDTARCDNATAANTTTAADLDNATTATPSDANSTTTTPLSDLANSTTTPSPLLAENASTTATPETTPSVAISLPRNQIKYGCETAPLVFLERLR
ncbi:hypothetical protein T484DRAFT_1868863 [Baffinella frigidus]|nr:hypothetical protein T484DRAFT_1868863 [Cryptophyta sp. CCMP2293]